MLKHVILTDEEISDLLALIQAKTSLGFDNYIDPISYAKRFLEIYDKLCTALNTRSD